MKDKIIYKLVYAVAYIHAVFPLGYLYFLSDLLYFPLYYLIRYRRKLVRKNLRNAFPEKSERELKAIEQSFYHHFCDYFFETLKLLHISDKEMSERFVFKNMELVDELMKNGKSCLMTLGHYGNWEWVTSITLWTENREDKVIGQIFRPLKDKAFDLFFFNLRKRFDSVGIAKHETLREIIKIRKANKNMLLGLISDQKPSLKNIYYWTTFLNQETAILTGTERIARQTGFSVVYLDVTRLKRGCYEGEVKLIAENVSQTRENEITEQYIRRMEKTILRDPAYWLWSHDRWKYKREEIE